MTIFDNQIYFLKYLKYKKKYVELKKEGGAEQTNKEKYINFLKMRWVTTGIDFLKKKQKQKNERATREAAKKKETYIATDWSDIFKPLDEISDGKILEGISYLIDNGINPSDDPINIQWSIKHMISSYAGLSIYPGLTNDEIFRIRQFISNANRIYIKKYKNLPF
tara:strand:- start:685 stop:1179 length:495 start_codon:yes stop_codon:yes gene_type:complete